MDKDVWALLYLHRWVRSQDCSLSNVGPPFFECLWTPFVLQRGRQPLLAAAWLMRAGGGWLSNGLAALGQPLRCPTEEMDLPACFAEAGVLVGLELGVVVGELVIQDGDGHAVEDDSKGDTSYSQDAAQVGFREHVPVANGGNAHLKERGAARFASRARCYLTARQFV